MNQRLQRREFVKRTLLAGAGIVVAPAVGKYFHHQILAETKNATAPQIRAVVGDRYFDNTMKAVDALGGMGRFVKKGATVGILINCPFDGRGAHVNPDIALAVVKMCLDAGAAHVVAIRETGSRYWRRSSLADSLAAEISRVEHHDEFTDVAIEKGKSLKHAEISTTLLKCDVFINVPIIKDHEGTRYTCTMKNVMGGCSSSSCREFHFGGSSILNVVKGYYSNPELLSQCIADANLVRRADLSIVDATEILASNGPAGPGELKRPMEVIAATDPVAADMYATKHLGLDWQDLLVIRYAREHGYGPASLKEVDIRTV